MKKIVVLLAIFSFFLSSCIGNTSLWGQYFTPTPLGWMGEIPAPPLPATDLPLTDPPYLTVTPFSTSTPTPPPNFITREVPAQSSTEESAPPPSSDDTILYYAQSGDWLPAVARRFEVGVDEIKSPKTISEQGLLDAGVLLIIPDRLDKTIQYTPAVRFMPDSEVVFSAAAADFDIEEYINSAGGYLASYREWLGTTAWTSGAKEIERLAYEHSVNPRLLLAVLDYEAQWVRGKPENQFRMDYPLGQEDYLHKGLFAQLIWGVGELYRGYYGWRKGQLTYLTFQDGLSLRLDPTLNAGTVAVMTLFSRHHTLNEWLRIMDANSGFPAFYRDMFGDPWTRAEALGNFFPPAFQQPSLSLPFAPGSTWAYTGGPHSAWGLNNEPLAAIDFAPPNQKPGCFTTDHWVLAMGAGLVVRSENGVVIVDMDGDGSEQTGWNIMYLHIAERGRVTVGQWVDQNDPIGHPSCEGGMATGTHVHIARKYNGEWMLVDGPIPFVLDGWRVVAGDKPYLGRLVNGEKTVIADVYGQFWSLITREDNAP